MPTATNRATANSCAVSRDGSNELRFAGASPEAEDPDTDADGLLGGQRAVPARQEPRVAHAGPAHQLVGHPERDERLPLLAGGPQHGQVRLVGQEVVENRRLTDPGRPVDEDEARSTCPDRRELGPQDRDLRVTSDEGGGVVGNGHGTPPRHSGLHGVRIA
jgi:hypothetical protein